MSVKLNRVCVYCASSQRLADEYLDVAYRLGQILAGAAHTIVYGGGSTGSMGRLADGALSAGGQVLGIIPRFMQELEWGHTSLTELRIVGDMRERKHEMLTESDAVIALPGGSGTLEELMEAITLKRLGIYLRPIVLVNTRAFFDRLTGLLEHCVHEGFMDQRHRDMWTVVDRPEDVCSAIASAPTWTKEARGFAAVT